jgi:1,4-alpha-glucan branching enzyme
MIHKAPSAQPGRGRVTFSLPASIWAEQIHLVGSFNDWDQTRTPMRQTASGYWTLSLELASDTEHQFRYLIDGETWYTDYNADGFVANEYGSDNSVVRTSSPDSEAEPRT